jgi:hypothetical protein
MEGRAYRFATFAKNTIDRVFVVAFTAHRQNTRRIAMRAMQDIIQRLRAEYLEMPGLRLKPAQVQRLCGIEESMCQMVLDSLVSAKFLCVKADGQYARLTEGFVPRPQPAKAALMVIPRAKAS